MHTLYNDTINEGRKVAICLRLRYISATMAITKGAKKAHRSSLRKQVFNLRRKSKMTDAVKKTRKLTASGAKADAEKSLSAAYQAIDKAAKRGVIKKNTAARKKSRLAAAIKKVS